MKNKKDFEKHACQFKNETECEEEVEEEGLELNEVEEEYYEEAN